MRLSRQVVLGLVLWMAVVAVGSLLVWTVISGVGDDLAASEQPVAGVTSSRDVVREPRRSPPASSPSSPRSSRRPSATPPSASPPEPATSAPATSAPATTQPSPTEPASPGPRTSTAPPPSTPSSPPAQRRTWQGAGGLVVAECDGPAIALVAAQPNAGFAVEVSGRGPESLEVKFEGREDESGREAQVRARCSGGVPAFTVQTERGDD